MDVHAKAPRFAFAQYCAPRNHNKRPFPLMLWDTLEPIDLLIVSRQPLGMMRVVEPKSVHPLSRRDIGLRIDKYYEHASIGTWDITSIHPRLVSGNT